MRRILPLLLSAALAVAPALHAQALGALHVTLTDSASGAPIRRAAVVVGSLRAARGTAAGVVHVDSLPVGTHTVHITCGRAPRGRLSAELRTTTIAIQGGDTTTMQLTVDGRVCDQRPVTQLSGAFRGYYESGFEHSRFVPCRDAASGVPRDHPARADSAWVWVSWTQRALTPARPWPAGEAREGYQRWYVEVDGTLEGPNRYGHLGVSEYALDATGIRRMRRGGPRGC